MSSSSANPRAVTIIRWIARIWSIVVLVIAVMIIVAPDPYAVEPARLAEMIVLGFLGVAVLSLLIAWRWEALGGAIAIVAVLAHIVGFRVVSGEWFPDAAGIVIPVLLFAFPGGLFLVCWALSRGKREVAGPKNIRSAT